jgi:outer membrane protein assembly factor BamB
MIGLTHFRTKYNGMAVCDCRSISIHPPLHYHYYHYYNNRYSWQNYTTACKYDSADISYCSYAWLYDDDSERVAVAAISHNTTNNGALMQSIPVIIVWDISPDNRHTGRASSPLCRVVIPFGVQDIIVTSSEWLSSSLNGSRIAIGTNIYQRLIVAVDLTTCRLLWSYNTANGTKPGGATWLSRATFSRSSHTTSSKGDKPLVYVHDQGGGISRILALHVITGELIWNVSMPAISTSRTAGTIVIPYYNTTRPTPIDTNNGYMVCYTTDKMVRCLSCQSGVELWTYLWQPVRSSSGAVGTGIDYRSVMGHDALHHRLYVAESPTTTLLSSSKTMLFAIDSNTGIRISNMSSGGAGHTDIPHGFYISLLSASSTSYDAHVKNMILSGDGRTMALLHTRGSIAITLPYSSPYLNVSDITTWYSDAVIASETSMYIDTYVHVWDPPLLKMIRSDIGCQQSNNPCSRHGTCGFAGVCAYVFFIHHHHHIIS